MSHVTSNSFDNVTNVVKQSVWWERDWHEIYNVVGRNGSRDR